MSRVKGLQCKDIPDLPILQFLADLDGKWANWYATVDGVPFERSVVIAMPPNLPRKLHHAKMVQMVHRGVVDGCTCGCRGDWVITEKGLAEIERAKLADPFANMSDERKRDIQQLFTKHLRDAAFTNINRKR